VESEEEQPVGRAFVGVGSNLHPEENVRGALGLLARDPRVRVTGISTFYRTKALPGPGAPADSAAEDPDYLNGVLDLQTDLDPERLIVLLEGVEEACGRTRTENKYAPRTMDLDLLLYLAPGHPGGSDPSADVRVVHPPHPEIRTRPFVAIPLLELAPELTLPPDDTPIREIAGVFDGPGGAPETALTNSLRRLFLGR